MRRAIAIAVLSGVAGALGVAADGAGASAVDLRLQLTSHRPATPTGAVLHIVYPDDGPGGRPKPVSKGVYEFPAGTSINEAAIPTCTASDTEFDAFEARLDSLCIQYRRAAVPDAPVKQLFLKDPAGNGIELNFAS